MGRKYKNRIAYSQVSLFCKAPRQHFPEHRDNRADSDISSKEVNNSNISKTLILKTRENCFNTPWTGKYFVEEELKVADGYLSVRIRVNMHQDVDNKDELIDSVIKRRFNIYQKWLHDVKKSGIIDKSAESVEVPQKCNIQLMSELELEFNRQIKDQEMANSHILKEIALFLNKSFNLLIFGTEDRKVLHENAEDVTMYKFKLIQINQIILGALLIVVLILLYSQSKGRTSSSDVTSLANN